MESRLGGHRRQHDGTGERLQQMAAEDPGLRVWVLPQNQGKGAAVLHGLQVAQQAGFTHALTMDSDGQHPADLIPAFMQASQARPDTMVLGRPVFDASRAAAARARPRTVQRLDQPGDAGRRRRRFALWLPRLSGSPT
jgi:glycosyltransferase involved in cell wall biosynthesis